MYYYLGEGVFTIYFCFPTFFWSTYLSDGGGVIY